jgi:integrase
LFLKIVGLFFCFVDPVMQDLSRTGVFNHPHLQELRNFLPSIIMDDVAPSTMKKYNYAFKDWSIWASKYNLNILPVKGETLALYLMDLAQSSGSFGVIEAAVAALSWVQKKHCYPEFSKHPLVVQVLASYKRKLSKPVVRKVALEVCHIQAIFTKCYTPTVALNILQILTLIVVGFAGFFRFDDLSQIKGKDIQFHQGYCTIFLPKRKNDQFRSGGLTYLYQSGFSTCPVSILKEFSEKSGLTNDLHLFRRVTKGNSIYCRKIPMSYTSAREQMLTLFAQAGLGHLDVGLHSLRSGGATRAASRGVPHSDIRRHGAWRSESAHLNYIDQPLSQLLEASKSLGL